MAARRRPVHRRAALGRAGAWALAAWLAVPQRDAWATPAGPAVATAATPLPPEVQEALPLALAVGAARMRFLGLDIYQARLWAAPGFRAGNWAQQPFALELAYARAFSGRRIAERALQEMRRQASLDAQQEAAWLGAMEQAFPDVRAGDRITGVHNPGLGARFWFNAQPRPEVRDPAFSRLFFGIWLSDASSEPRLRDELLGRAS